VKLTERSLLALGAGCLILAACGDAGLAGAGSDSGGFGGPDAPSGSDTPPSIIPLAAVAPWTTRFSGTRRVESHVEIDGEMVELIYREDVRADGTGNFAIDPVEVLSWVPDPTMLEDLLKLREGFLYRYRDFQFRDLALFFENYLVVDMGLSIQVAGRDCTVLQIQRNEPNARVFFVFLDSLTGLALRFEERDSMGTTITFMEFESYDDDPDLEGTSWYSSSNQESALDITADLGPQAGFDVFEPKVLPDGYKLWRASTLIDPAGKSWIKQTFTDGVEPLFFFHEGGESGPGMVENRPDFKSDHVLDPLKADEVWVYQMGAVNVLQGAVRKTDVVALGKVDEQDLLDLLESAID
jgi:hypothetical protein